MTLKWEGRRSTNRQLDGRLPVAVFHLNGERAGLLTSDVL
jgi:hypothetical protein